MFENSFANRVLHKTLWITLLPACMVWSAFAVLSQPAGMAQPPQRAGGELPAQWQGAPLRPLALSEVEQRFARNFPGSLARFAIEPRHGGTAPAEGGGADGSIDAGGWQVLVLRGVDKPTRMLHPAADCYQGLGYRIAAQQLALDRQRQLWRCFEATRGQAGNGQRLRVCERIVDVNGQGFTDTSAWYWSAAMGRSQGPWQAITVARPL
jgi:hypothetical protein